MGERPIPDWEHLSFGFHETESIFWCEGDSSHQPVWSDGEFRPFGNISFSPAAAFLSYGLGIFEGLKAERSRDGRVLLFRPSANAARFRASAERLMMAPFPAPQFIAAVEGITRRNLRFVPPAGKGSLYIRPTQHAVQAKLGIGAGSKFAVSMYSSPVGDYFAATQKVRLRVLEQGRCAPGAGSAKAIGNYAANLFTATRWKEAGFDDVLYLDTRHLRFLTETSGSNVFVHLESGVLVTPPLDDQILPGVTRDSVIRVARELLGIAVEERPISIDEVLANGAEVFCTGTAWTVQPVHELVYQDRGRTFPRTDLERQLRDTLRGIQSGERDDPFGWTAEVACELTETHA